MQSFKQRLMRLPKPEEQKVKTTNRPVTKAARQVSNQAPASRQIPNGPQRFNYRSRQPVAPVVPNWLNNKKDKKVLDLTKKSEKQEKKPSKKTPKTQTTPVRARTTTRPKTLQRNVPTLNRKENHIKIASPLSAGGRFFGYKSITNDIPAAPMSQSPFDIDGTGVKMAMAEKQVFGRGSYGRNAQKTTRCFSCQGSTYSECFQAGQTQTCMSDETSCYVREYTQSDGVVGVYMGCQNIFQCVSDFNANSPATSQGIEIPEIAGLSMRGGYSVSALCKPGEAGSVCHQCCSQGDDCNRSWAQTQLDTLSEWLNLDI